MLAVLPCAAVMSGYVGLTSKQEVASLIPGSALLG